MNSVPVTTMRKILYLAVLGLSATGIARADELNMQPVAAQPPAETAPAAEAPATTAATETAPAPTMLPKRGSRMAQVAKQFGEPKEKHAPVGGHQPKHPPITRWDYDAFSVFFEHGTVIDTVVPSRLTPVKTTEGLQHAK
ncbi:MAG: hypothetical protein ACRETW_16115 [Stenotrophobium sp.]